MSTERVLRENGAGLDVHVLMGAGFQDKPHYNQVSTGRVRGEY